MSTYRNKCGVSRFLQGREVGDLAETRLTKASSIVCDDSAHSAQSTYLETLYVQTNVAQIFVVTSNFPT